MEDITNYTCEKKIEISLADLQNNDNNLKVLSLLWSFIPGATKCYINTSRGLAADYTEDCVSETCRMAALMQTLLDNSIAFFEGVGIKFKDAEMVSIQEIDKIN